MITKRAIDVVGAAAGLVLLAPPIAAIALCVRWRMGSPVLFRQSRPGLRGKSFVLYKFRTMTETEGPGGAGDSDTEERRLTRLGRLLRATSLDELPELYNVLKGDMSLVGPRPLLVEYLDRYNAEQARRHDVKPGITGWAQVNGRNAITWDEKFQLDVWYVDHVSVWLDMKILGRTFVQVLKQDGIGAAGHATMPRFRKPTR